MANSDASSNGSLVRLGAARDEIELAFWRDVLSQDGIRVLVKNRDALSTAYYFSAPPYSYEVYVLAADESRARWLLGLQAEA